MSRRAKAVIRYDGPALADHEMDVHHLAPALLAFGDLCKIANSTFNQDIAAVKVLVRADIEQKCFQLEFELVQTLFESLVTLMDAESIKDAKELLEWIGIIGATSSFLVGGGLLGLFKFLSKKSSKDEISVSLEDANGNVTYQIIGNENTFVVPAAVDKLAQDPRSLKAVKSVLAPLAEEGYETLEFEYEGESVTYFTRREAKQILALEHDELVIHREGETVSIIRTSVKVRKAIHEGEAAWGINYKRVIDAKMLDKQWLEDFQAGRISLPVGSKLLIDLKETVPVDPEGIQTGPAKYEILKVIGVQPPPDQYTLISN